MSKKSKLSAIFAAAESTNADELSALSLSEIPNIDISTVDIKHITLSKIYVNPNQFRKYFDLDEQEKLKNSIQQNGFQGAILLRPLPERLKTKVRGDYEFELVYGESRYRAVKELGYETIPSIVQELTDSDARRNRLDENLVRKNLNPLEEVEGLLEIAADELDISPKKVVSLLDEVVNAAHRGKDLKSDIALQAKKLQMVLDYYKKGTLGGFRAKLRKLQRLPDDIKQALQQGKIDWTKAIEIAPVKDVATRKKLLQWIVKENPSVVVIRKKRKELVKPIDDGQRQSMSDDNLVRKRFYNGLAKISKSEEWSKPENQERIEHLIQEIEEIFHIKIF